MSDRARLNFLLGQLAEAAPRSAPTTGSRPELLVGILRAIDETILPRDITLKSEDAEITLAVAKRRLLSIDGAIKAEFGDDPSHDELRALADTLTALFLGKSLAISDARPEAAVDPSAVGASASVLAEVWAGEGAVSGLDDIVAAAVSVIRWQDGQETLRRSEDDAFLALQPDRSALRALTGSDGGAVALPTVADGLARVFVFTSDEEVLADLPAQELGSTLRAVGLN